MPGDPSWGPDAWPPTTIGASEGGPLAGSGRAGGASVEGAPPAVDAGRYEIVGRLGAGGMGEVYEARDRALGRPVALKFLRGATPERAARLRQEARAQARLDHPNVCQVYEVGGAGDGAYIAMQLVRGRRLDEAAAEMSLAEKVRVLREVAEAVHEAHRLGVVHRDLKPANVLVGRSEGGRFTPVVLDFGLAYEVERGHGLTETGALMGTPAYMAPEQARGEVQSVDHRSDVYALGATLFCLLAGAPPFVAPTRAATLQKVLTEEAPPLRARRPELPRDLETVVLKCLHKEPSRRYASARALAEDLGRVLDGEPVVGRRSGRLERLARAVRRNRPLAAALSAALALTLASAAVGAYGWLEGRRARAGAAERARLAEELGRQVEQIEWLARAAYSLPLHDTGPERRAVRERMEAMASRWAGAVGPAGGLVHYALGRGHLSLGEFEAARAELERARSLGADAPELHHALGRAYGELYRVALDGARRGGGGDWLVERRRQLERQYLAPARVALENSRGLALESPALLEGLLSLYRRDYDAAERAAERATAEAPWATEARRLGGDVAYARAMERFERGDYDAAGAGLERAADLYERAAEVGRSDAQAHEALAETWLQRADLEGRRGRPVRDAIARALAAADRAVGAEPARASAHARRAQILRLGYNARRAEGDAEAARALADWIAAGERAVELDPADVYALDVLGQAYFQSGLREAREGRDPGAAWREAVAQMSRALEIEPNYPWGLNDLALIYRWRGNYSRQYGRDPGDDYVAAERHLLRAAESDPKYLFAYENLSRLYNEVGAYRLSRGLDPEVEVRGALEAGGRALSLDAQFFAAHLQLAEAELTRAQFFYESGDEPGVSVERALAHVGRARDANPASGRAALLRAQVLELSARYALRAGGDPRPRLEAARAALDEASRGPGDCVDCHVADAQLCFVEAGLAGREGRPTAPALRRALAAARRAVAMYPYFEAHQELARACWLLAKAAPAEAPALIDEGARQVDLALGLDPSLATAHAVRAGLLLARAQASAAPERRLALAHEARASLTRAFELNPLLQRDEAWPGRAIALLLGEAPAPP